MTRAEHLLWIVAEECAEVARRAGEAARSGLAGVQPGQALTNAGRLMGAVNDFVAAYAMLNDEAGPLLAQSESAYRAALEAKRAKVERSLRHSACGAPHPGGRQ